MSPDDQLRAEARMVRQNWQQDLACDGGTQETVVQAFEVARNYALTVGKTAGVPLEWADVPELTAAWHEGFSYGQQLSSGLSRPTTH